MAAIEADVEKNSGIYPFSDGEVSSSEVLRRAGLSLALLQKQRHRELRQEIAAWTTRIRSQILRGAKVVRAALTDRVDHAADQVREIMQRYAEAELERIDLIARLEELERRCSSLEAENAALRAVIGSKDVPTEP